MCVCVGSVLEDFEFFNIPLYVGSVLEDFEFFNIPLCVGSVLGDFEFLKFPCVWARYWRTLSFQYSPVCGFCTGGL